MYYPQMFHTDLYQLTMGQSYFNCDKRNDVGTFELFFRKLPFNGGYAVFCGRNGIYNFINNLDKSLQTFINIFGSERKAKSYFLDNFNFSPDYIEYLFNDLIDDIRSLEIKTVEEGEIVFANTPLVQVTGKMIPMQFIETPFLQIVNSQSIIATKAARIKYVAGDRLVADYGLRRAHNPNLTYAAMIGGCDATSNVNVGAELKVKTTGTIAHSYIMSFGSDSNAELEAFREYAKTFPDNYTLLVDTFDIEQGIRNAIKVAKEMNEKGFNGIRIDSGDQFYWAIKARDMLDEAGMKNVKIFASSDLDEYLVESLDSQAYRDYGRKKVPIDGFGIGTKLITAYDQPALGAVYKLVEIKEKNFKYVIKVSGNKIKTTIPGKKRLIRYKNSIGDYQIDIMCLPEEELENKTITVFDKDHADKNTTLDLKKSNIIELLKPVDYTPIDKINVQSDLKNLPIWHKRLQHPHIYKVSLSEKLFKLRQKMIKEAVV